MFVSQPYRYTKFRSDRLGGCSVPSEKSSRSVRNSLLEAAGQPPPVPSEPSTTSSEESNSLPSDSATLPTYRIRALRCAGKPNWGPPPASEIRRAGLSGCEELGPQLRRGVCPAVGPDEPSPLGRRAGVELESSAVDSDVVVVPAERGQVVRPMRSPLRAGDYVVDFEAVCTGASVDDASVVSGEDGSPQAGAYLLCGGLAGDVVFVDGVVFGFACAVDEVDGVGTDSGSSQDVGALFPV